MYACAIERLPAVKPSSGVLGETDPKLFGSAIPIAGVAGDQQAATFGQGCFKSGMAKNTYGTGCFLLMNTGSKAVASRNGLLTTIGWQIGDRVTYCLEGSVFIAGAAVQWLRDGLGLLGKAPESEAMARTLSSNEGVYFVPALTGLGAPAWEPEARGTIVGLTRGTTREHIVRAALEAMAYGTADVLEAMRGASGAPLDVLRVDGGATFNDWLMQFQADVLGVPVERPDVIETTAMGAAGLAGIAGGVWASAEEFFASRSYQRFAPAGGTNVARQGLGGWRRAVRATVGWARDRE